ncbi:HupE / UreJ protein [Shewanella psychrophila]|uniref:HupE / UreJ protein n=1 Tax=Shewanella psychrophila TaxID=225848 RepID=A0A1S6HUH6_9GAMM|nr:HupE/UreJ family protein [Shewanella psychrophila]AQS39144.1 HupE / UreJ protein [Shewanella psychrophila]
MNNLHSFPLIGKLIGWSKPYLTTLLLAIPLIMHASIVEADEIRPAYLELTQLDNTSFKITWKLPRKETRVLKLSPEFPDNCTKLERIHRVHTASADISHWSIQCDGGLADKTVSIPELANTTTDILIRVQHLNGATQMARLTPVNTSFVIESAAESSNAEVIKVYTLLGIEHILLGFDHLLFVFALLLIIKDRRRLIGAITAFTLAHSITLALASLGIASIALPPVEAVIALSILFLAVEIIHGQKGKVGIAERSPWMVAFIFGLLHGFGFAGALAEIGLPQNAIPLALLFFNVGVELGQLAFVAAVLIAGGISLRWVNLGWISPHSRSQALTLMAYGIGGLSAFWVIERTVSFWA